jgi:hypothetical protein
MVAANRNDRYPSARSNLTPLINRLGARRKEIPSCQQREMAEAGRARWFDQPGSNPLWRGMETTRRWRRLPSAEDIRLHGWLAERLAAVHYERHGLRPKLRRLIFENRLVRWLALPARPTGKG